MRPRHWGWMLAACSILAGPLGAQDNSYIPVIDAHVHMNDRARLMALLERQKVARAVIFWGRDSDNERLAAAAAKYPDRLIPFVSISPERRRYRAFWQRDDPALLAELEALLKTGIYRGIGEISVVHFPSRGFPEVDFNPLGALMTGIMGLAEHYRVPVTIHCEVTRLREFGQLLAAHRGVQVIWGHGGYTPYFLARRMLEQHPNLTYELSARTWRNHPRSPDYTIFRNETEVWPRWLELIEANPRRFVVGTDASQRRRESDLKKLERVRLLLRQLKPETRAFVATKNILRLTGLRP